MREIKAPERVELDRYRSTVTIFLAGSIEMGTAENWQTRVVSALEKYDDLVIFNPRRDDWDSSWKQEINNPNFYEQVTWELDMLDRSDIIFMYFDPNTKSPISLLELGLYADKCGADTWRKEMIVCCPNGFWRKGNVDIVCQRYEIPVFENLDTALVELKNRIN